MLESYITVATDDITCLGCLVLCNSLKQTGTEKKISVLVYSNVSQHLRNVLQKSFDYLYCTEDLFLPNHKEDLLNDLKEYQKLKCWLLTKFTKCVFLESDVLVVENIDDLFERHELSAVADPRWPDSFDTGVFVYEPNSQTYLALIDYSLKNKVKDNSIQGLLNLFFSNWNVVSIEHKIPFLYNCQLNSTFYTHSNALVHFGRSIKAARLGNSVWDMMQPSMLQDVNYDNWNRLWLLWWKIFNEMVKPSLTTNETQDFNRINWGNDKFHSDDKSFSESHYTPLQSHANKTNDEENKETQDFNRINWENEKFHSDEKSSTESHFTLLQSHTNKTSDEEYKEHQIVNVTVCSDETSSGGYHNMPNDVQDYITFNELYSSDNKNVNQTSSNDVLCPIQKFPDLETHIQPNNPNADENVVTSLNVLSESDIKEEIENNHRQQWERGEIDYMGKDSFQNILSKLNAKINNQNTEANMNTEE